MASTGERLDRATDILRRLPARRRGSALDFIEYLAADTELDGELGLSAEEIAEDKALVARVRQGDLSETVTLEEARRQLARRGKRPSHV